MEDKKYKFELLEDGKVRFTFDAGFTDAEVGDPTSGQEMIKVGLKKYTNEYIFDSKEMALLPLDADLSKYSADLEAIENKMRINEHNLDRFSDLKDLVLEVAKLNNEFKEIKNIPEKLYADNPKKYQKLLSEFNKSKNYVLGEISSLNEEYKKFQEYEKEKKTYDLYSEQLDKIKEQRADLLKLFE